MIAITDAQSVAWIGGLFGLISLIVGALVKFVIERATHAVSKLNTDEHLLNKEVLDEIRSDVKDLTVGFNRHLEWHIDNPPTNTKKDAAA